MPAKRKPATGKSRSEGSKRTDKRSTSGAKRKPAASGRGAGRKSEDAGFGREGSRGGRGAAGARGRAGEQGSRGRAGEQASRGRAGEQGSRGRAGGQSSRGSAGAQGSRGRAGEQRSRGRGSEERFEERSPRGRQQEFEGRGAGNRGRGREDNKFNREENKFGRAGGDARRKPRFEAESQPRGRFQKKRDDDWGEQREFSRKPTQSRFESKKPAAGRGGKQEFEGREGGRGAGPRGRGREDSREERSPRGRKPEFEGRDGGRGAGSRGSEDSRQQQSHRGRGGKLQGDHSREEETRGRGRKPEFEGREGGRGDAPRGRGAAGERSHGRGREESWEERTPRGRGRKQESDGYGREGGRDAGSRGRGRKTEADDFGSEFKFDSGEQHQEDASSSIYGKNAVISYLESLLEARRQESQQDDEEDDDETDDVDDENEGEENELVEIEMELDDEDMEALRQSGFLTDEDEEDLDDDEEEIEDDEEAASKPRSKSSKKEPPQASRRWHIIKKPDIRKIFLVADPSDEKVRRIEQLAGRLRIAVAHVPKAKIDSLTAPGTKHQGVLAKLSPVELLSQGDLLELIQFEKEQIESSGGNLNGFVVVALDGIEDPRNVGAIIRAAEASGAHAIILPERRAAGVTETVAKTSAGAVAHIPVAQVTNLVSVLSELKELGFWVLGLAADGKDTIYRFDLKRPVVLVIGSEGKGLRPLVSSHCDALLSIPILGKSESLNASVAAGVALYEVVRQNMK